MAKRQSIRGLGRDIYFEGGQRTDETVSRLTAKPSKRHMALQRATFYVEFEQQERLETLKIKLRSRMRQDGVNRRQVDKSELVRLALDLLTEQNEDMLVKRLTDKE